MEWMLSYQGHGPKKNSPLFKGVWTALSELNCSPKFVRFDNDFCHKDRGTEALKHNPPGPGWVDVEGEAQENEASGAA